MEEVYEELGNTQQTPVKQEFPVEKPLEKRDAKDPRICTGGRCPKAARICTKKSDDPYRPCIIGRNIDI
ncbi:unnamed protein product [Ectocarpus sp. 12 AP-2014]